MRKCRGMPDPGSYVWRFGSLVNAYALIGQLAGRRISGEGGTSAADFVCQSWMRFFGASMRMAEQRWSTIMGAVSELTTGGTAACRL